MTRRRFYAPPSAFAPDEKSLTLSAEETRHARDVLRLQSGDEIYVFDGAGREFQCVIESIERNSTQLSVVAEVEPVRPESILNLTLAIALLKNEKFDLVIQKATELGVTRIVPLIAERADIRLRDRKDARVIRWQRIAHEAAKQSGRASVPEVAAPLTLHSLLIMPETQQKKSSDNVLRLLFSERCGRSLAEATDGMAERPVEIVVMVGPEGGWTDQEIELAREGGCEIVTLGGRVLRAETAGITVVALLQHRFGDLV
jgi:16S rRNA (uracil1498-N3)-methyltransferase